MLHIEFLSRTGQGSNRFWERRKNSVGGKIGLLGRGENTSRLSGLEAHAFQSVLGRLVFGRSSHVNVVSRCKRVVNKLFFLED
jgi:hypothetical protein